MLLNSLDIDALVRVAAGSLLNSLLLGTGLAALAWIVSRFVRSASSGTRFAISFVSLIAIVLLPWVGSIAVASSSTHSALAPGVINLPESLAYFALVAWMLGAALGLAHILHGLYRLHLLRANCTAVDLTELDPILQTTLARIQSRRNVTLCVSNVVRVPAAIGYIRPMVVLPAWALAEIPPQEMNAILLHELAHLRRYDDWTNLAQKLAKALFFFHPAVWFIESRLTLEREMACDDAVLAANFAPRSYAESLVSLAEKSFLRRGVQLAQAAVGHVHQLKIRLAAILRSDRNPQKNLRIGGPSLALISFAAVLATYGAVCSPQWITFSAGATDQVAGAATLHAMPELNARLQPVNLALSRNSRGLPLSVEIASRPILRSTKREGSQSARARSQGAVVVPLADGEPSSPPVDLASMSPHLSDYQVLVIFQGAELGPDGPVLWRVTVLHITPAQQVLLTGGIQKQI
jgi:beta-lactamase regulating signal transducer with metallopeptidase domain